MTAPEDRTADCCPNGHLDLIAHCDLAGCRWVKCKNCRYYGGRWSDQLQMFLWREPVVRGIGR